MCITLILGSCTFWWQAVLCCVVLCCVVLCCVVYCLFAYLISTVGMCYTLHVGPTCALFIWCSFSHLYTRSGKFTGAHKDKTYIYNIGVCVAPDPNHSDCGIVQYDTNNSKTYCIGKINYPQVTQSEPRGLMCCHPVWWIPHLISLLFLSPISPPPPLLILVLSVQLMTKCG